MLVVKMDGNQRVSEQRSGIKENARLIVWESKGLEQRAFSKTKGEGTGALLLEEICTVRRSCAGYLCIA